MISDWLYRKIFKSFLNVENIDQNAKNNKIIGDETDKKQKNIYDFPIRRGSRYRYYIPQIKPRLDTFASFTEENKPCQTRPNANKNEESKPVTKKSNRQLTKIKKVYVFPSGSSENSVIAEYELPNSKTGILREVHPIVRQFFLVPMIPDENSNTLKIETEGPKHITKPEMKENKSSDLTEKCIANGDSKKNFESKRERDIPDVILNTPFEEQNFGSGLGEAYKDKQRCRFYVPYPERNCRDNDSDLLHNEEFHRNEKDDGESMFARDEWWDDLTDYETSTTHENVRDKCHKASEEKKCRHFSKKFRNLFFKLDKNEEIEEHNLK